MWKPFCSEPILTEEDSSFQVECYKWLFRNLGDEYFYKQSRLVLPIKEHFPENKNPDINGAEATFEQVKVHAGLSDWVCILEAQEHDPELVVSPTVVVQNVEQNPHGTFSANENNEVIITYNPKLISNPTQMVATFAHELSHYLTATLKDSPPGGWDNWEFATDLCATFLGFGLFMANSVFSFEQYTTVDSIGWRTTGGGYLSEAENCYSLAIFLILKDIPPEKAYPHCKPNVKSYLKKALKELKKSGAIEKLKNLNYV